MNKRNLPCECGSGYKSKKCCHSASKIQQRREDAIAKARADAVEEYNKRQEEHAARLKEDGLLGFAAAFAYYPRNSR